METVRQETTNKIGNDLNTTVQQNTVIQHKAFCSLKQVRAEAIAPTSYRILYLIILMTMWLSDHAFLYLFSKFIPF